MDGTLIPVLAMTRFDFGDMTDGAVAQVPLVQNIDLSRYQKGALLVRVHEVGVGSQASIAVSLVPVLPSAEDPSKVFKANTTLASVTIDSAVVAGRLFLEELAEPTGAYATLVLTATQPAPATTLSATISVELSLKN